MFFPSDSSDMKKGGSNESCYLRCISEAVSSEFFQCNHVNQVQLMCVCVREAVGKCISQFSCGLFRMGAGSWEDSLFWLLSSHQVVAFPAGASLVTCILILFVLHFSCTQSRSLRRAMLPSVTMAAVKQTISGTGMLPLQLMSRMWRAAAAGVSHCFRK